MAVCRFFLAGNCRYGAHCKFEHPKGPGSMTDNNRFAPLQNQKSGNVSSASNRGHGSRDYPYKLDKTTIIKDLSQERPQWILSAYGAGKDAPIQLFGGLPREQSFEELRFRHYGLAAQGRLQEAIQEAQSLVKNAEQQIQTALNDVDGAIRYVLNGEHQHPNRIDIANAKGVPPSQAQNSSHNQQPVLVFGQPSNTASTFGKPPISGPLSGAPAPAFGQPSALTSTFGQASSSSFGQPSMLGQTATLGRPATSFGQPAPTFGKPSAAAPAFGQPSAPSPFGTSQQNPSLSGQSSGQNSLHQPLPSQSSNPFGQPSGPTQRSPFGQPHAPPQPSIFGRSSGSNFADAPNQPTTLGNNVSAPASNPFGPQASAPSKAVFGQTSTTQSSKAQVSFANRPVPSFGFNPESLKPSSNHFNANFTKAQPAAIATFNGSTSRITNTQAPGGASAREDPAARITNWKGKPVSYIDDEPCCKGNDGSWQKIWFPHGPPAFTKSPELPEEVYKLSIQNDYRFMKERGSFKEGVMPEVPPKREWCGWDF